MIWKKSPSTEIGAFPCSNMRFFVIWSSKSTARATEIIFAVGINDSLYRTSFNNTETHIGEFESNINTLINNSKKLHGAIVFVGLTNVDERFTKPLSYSETGKCYDNTLIAKYNNKLKEIAARSNVPFINVYGILAPEEIDDGVHPNTEGHHTLYEAIKKGLARSDFFWQGLFR